MHLHRPSTYSSGKPTEYAEGSSRAMPGRIFLSTSTWLKLYIDALLLCRFASNIYNIIPTDYVRTDHGAILRFTRVDHVVLLCDENRGFQISVPRTESSTQIRHSGRIAGIFRILRGHLCLRQHANLYSRFPECGDGHQDGSGCRIHRDFHGRSRFLTSHR